VSPPTPEVHAVEPGVEYESPAGSASAVEAPPADEAGRRGFGSGNLSETASAVAVGAESVVADADEASSESIARELDVLDDQLARDPADVPQPAHIEPHAAQARAAAAPVFEVERSWFSGEEANESSKIDHFQLAAEMGLQEFVDELGGAIERAAPATTSPRPAAATPSTADVFASLLAAEQGTAVSAVALQTAPPQLTDQMLSTIAARVVEGLQAERLHDEVRRAVTSAVDGVLRESVDDAVRGVVGLTVQKALEDALPGALQQAVNDAVAKAIPAAVSQAITAAVGDSLHAIVVETSERLIREEIARIREHTAHG
jgi:hypothetical protein